jgi:hypothetical protein
MTRHAATERGKHYEDDSYLFSHLSTDMCKTLLAIEALGLNTTVSEHLQDLSVLCSIRHINKNQEKGGGGGYALVRSVILFICFFWSDGREKKEKTAVFRFSHQKKTLLMATIKKKDYSPSEKKEK